MAKRADGKNVKNDKKIRIKNSGIGSK